MVPFSMFGEETRIFIHKNVSGYYEVGAWQLSTESVSVKLW